MKTDTVSGKANLPYGKTEQATEKEEIRHQEGRKRIREQAQKPTKRKS